MANKRLSDIDVQRIAAALDETGGKIRKAEDLLKKQGTPYAFGSIQKVAKGYKGQSDSAGDASRVINVEDPLFRTDLIRTLRKRFVSIASLSRMFMFTEGQMTEAVAHLEDRGYNVLWDGKRARIVKGEAQTGGEMTDNSPLVGDWRQFGAIGDTHVCSHAQRLDVVEAAYDHFQKKGITSVYHTGNIVDGHTHFNRFELHCHGITDQCNYLIDHYPQRKDITTYFITGDCHEGWWQTREGLNFGRYLELEAKDRGRNDLVYAGFMEANVKLLTPGGYATMRLMHPGGGTAYAFSYKPQKIVEGFSGGEKPSILLIGHYHKLSYDLIRNVHVFQTGCAQDQTTFMRKKTIQAHVGYWVIGIQQDARGAVRRVRQEVTNYFDRKYHAVAPLVFNDKKTRKGRP